jgi:hypothetical protein
VGGLFSARIRGRSTRESTRRKFEIRSSNPEIIN